MIIKPSSAGVFMPGLCPIHRLKRKSSATLSTGFCCNVWSQPGGICERGSASLSDGILEQCSDEHRLGLDVAAADVPNLSLPDHRHRLVASQRSSRRPEATKAEAWIDQPFHVAVVLL